MPPPVPKSRISALLVACLIAAAAFFPVGAPAAVVLTLFNTNPLLDSDNSTALLGTGTTGDRVQLVVDGNSDGIAAPDAFGQPANDDFLLPVLGGDNPTWVGNGEPSFNWNQGLFTEVLTYEDAYINETAYLRFWNDTTEPLATHFGVTATFLLPAGNGLGNATLDFAPSASFFTATAFSALNPLVLPEPGTAASVVLAMSMFWIRVRFRRATLSPEDCALRQPDRNPHPSDPGLAWTGPPTLPF